MARTIQSQVMDEAVRQLLESEDLWVLVDEIARSPAVTEAITQQSLGFADQVFDPVRVELPQRGHLAGDRGPTCAAAQARRWRPDEPAAGASSP